MQNRKGFTLIELLIVVVIIGILAAIAIPKFASTKEKAYLASMKSDLRNLATAQEGYFADNQVYLSGTATNLAGVADPAGGDGHFIAVGRRDDHLHGDGGHRLERRRPRTQRDRARPARSSSAWRRLRRRRWRASRSAPDLALEHLMRNKGRRSSGRRPFSALEPSRLHRADPR